MTTTRQKILIDGFHEFNLKGSSSGGMGKVYFLEPSEKIEVHHTPMGRTLNPFIGSIAAKFPKRMSDSIIFERECRIWLELSHSHIVPLLRLTQIGGQMAAVMPLYHQSLRELIDENHNTTIDNHLYEQLAGICEGLEYAWEEHRLLHLDLKPQNILNYYKDRMPYLSIADWGMARYNDHCFSIAKLKQSSDKSIDSLEVYGGTLPYMSPERILSAIEGREYKHLISDDIFSLGVIFSEIATNINPCLQGTLTQADVVDQILSGNYYNLISELDRRYPSPLMELAGDCCHPEINRRPKNYKQIINRVRKNVVF